MKDYHRNVWVILLVPGLLTMGLWGCRGLKPTPTTELRVIPEEIAITKALHKKPVQFRGWGYAPEEYIVVDLMIPTGVKTKKVPKRRKNNGNKR